MIYQIRMNKRLKNIRVYVIRNRIGHKDTFMTKLFMRLFNQGRRDEQQSAAERLG